MMKSNLQAMNLCVVRLVFAGIQLVDNRDSFHRELGRKSSSCVETSGHCRGRWEGVGDGRWEGVGDGMGGGRWKMGGGNGRWKMGEKDGRGK